MDIGFLKIYDSINPYRGAPHAVSELWQSMQAASGALLKYHMDRTPYPWNISRTSPPDLS